MKIRSDMMLGAMGLMARAAQGAPTNNAPQPHLYATTLGGFPATVDYFDGSSSTAITSIPVPASGALDLAFSANNRQLVVATGDGPGPNDISLIDAVPSSSTFNRVVKNIKIDTTIKGVAVKQADLVFVNPANNWAFFAQQGTNPGTAQATPAVIGAFSLNKAQNGQPTILPVNANIPNPLSTQAAFTHDGSQLWWPMGNADSGPGIIIIINTLKHDPNFLQATSLDAGPGFFPAGIAISHGKAFISSSTGELRVYDVKTHALLHSTTAGSGGAPNFVVASNTVDRVYADTVGGNFLHAYDDNGVFIDETQLGGVGGSNDMKLSANRTQAFVADTNGNLIQVVDLTKQPPELTFAFGKQAPAHLAVQGTIK